MLANRTIMPCQPSMTQVVHPLGAVFEASDGMRARTLLDLSVVDQNSLRETNRRLTERGLNKIKVRITIDCTAKGANSAVHSASFTYASLRSGIDMIERGPYWAYAT